MSVTLESIRSASEAIHSHVLRTALLHSRTLSLITGAEVWIKMENKQFTASFKERGACNKMEHLTDAEKQSGVIAVSAGNHAQGVAYHAKRLGIAATIVMPVSTPITKVRHTRSHGAKVILAGTTFTEAEEHALHLRDEKRLVYIHPYDDERIIAGQGTVGLEMVDDGPAFDDVIVPIGGGGLIAGMGVAFQALSPQTRVTGVQTTMYPGMHDAFKGLHSECGGSTIAEGIAVKSPGKLTLKVARDVVDDILLVEERHIEEAITLLLDVEKTVAEGAGAAGLAALLAHPERFQGKTVGLVLCGGNIDTRLLTSVLTRSLVREKRLTNVHIVSEDRPGILAQVATILGQNDANIIEVGHNRTALDVPAKGAEFDILIETRDADHTRQVLEALAKAGFPDQTPAKPLS